MKNIFSLLLSITLFLSATLPSFAFYDDVSESHQYHDSIEYMYNLGLLPADYGKTLNPDEKITLKELYKLLLIYSDTPLSTDESDLDTIYLQTAVELGILTPRLTLSPDKPLTKHQTLKTMFDSLGVGIDYLFNRKNFYFTDLKKDSKLAAIAQKALEIGITEKNIKSFKMAKRITKAETIDYLRKIHDYGNQNGGTLIITAQTPSNNYNSTESKLLENDYFETLLDVWTRLKTRYLHKKNLKDNDLVQAAIKGMVNEVDDTYTEYQKKNEASAFLESFNQEYEGVGIAIQAVDDQIKIVRIFENSPAQDAGLKSNDIITHVEGKSVNGMTPTDVTKLIKGKSGTSVKIKISRNNRSKTYTVKRANINYTTVFNTFYNHNDKKIAHVEIHTFIGNTYDDFVKIAKEIIAENTDGIILDLRDNPGGLINSAINIIGLFSDEKITAVQLKDSNNDTSVFKTKGNGLLKDYANKIVIIINENSASASEIVAGALKDHGLTKKIIGENSYGKGTAQEVTTYNDGSYFKYTSARWLTPDGTDMSTDPIKPDHLVKEDQLNEALNEF
jgi:C-terminal peptidase prc